MPKHLVSEQDGFRLTVSLKQIRSSDQVIRDMRFRRVAG